MPERVKKTKCGGGGVVLREKIEVGYAVEGKEDEMRRRGWRVKIWVGVDHTKKSRGGGFSGKLCLL